MPDADPADWEWITAGQRVQVVKTVKGKGTIAGFGTEVVTSGDGSLAALLGASPGASASVCIILDVLHASFPKRFAQWEYALRGMIPSYGAEPQDDPAEASERWRRMARALHLDRTEKPEAETHSAPPS
ncbi:malate:quinone oxidoreductase [Arthrobacter sp. ATA002]|uniref:malate:quinone oxidoreductase n=1 Tax=Arthrobacter sp. ATA002 TaxID=2991715 RepID=UPI0022A6FFC4|nr:malate:quinone oxidoreductase [Arthrobacter sp. ATA002]WAP51354.1 malate:quinone oxidoreductase [Arthrobacter sp. ATA002]